MTIDRFFGISGLAIRLTSFEIVKPINCAHIRRITAFVLEIPQCFDVLFKNFYVLLLLRSNGETVSK